MEELNLKIIKKDLFLKENLIFHIFKDRTDLISFISRDNYNENESFLSRNSLSVKFSDGIINKADLPDLLSSLRKDFFTTRYVSLFNQVDYELRTQVNVLRKKKDFLKLRRKITDNLYEFIVSMELTNFKMTKLVSSNYGPIVNISRAVMGLPKQAFNFNKDYRKPKSNISRKASVFFSVSDIDNRLFKIDTWIFVVIYVVRYFIFIERGTFKGYNMDPLSEREFNTNYYYLTSYKNNNFENYLFLMKLHSKDNFSFKNDLFPLINMGFQKNVVSACLERADLDKYWPNYGFNADPIDLLKKTKILDTKFKFSKVIVDLSKIYVDYYYLKEKKRDITKIHTSENKEDLLLLTNVLENNISKLTNEVGEK